GHYANNNEICKAWCASHRWIDGNGQLFNCDSVAWHSNGSADPFLNGCTDAGTLLAASPEHDPRKIRPATIPVKWVERVGVDPNSSDLVKLEASGFGNAGAVSNHVLESGDGS